MNQLFSFLRLLVLKAEVHASLGQPAMALPHLLHCISLCREHHLLSTSAQLCLAQVQVEK